MRTKLLAVALLVSQGAFAQAQKIVPPARGSIPVAFVITESATMIDFAGPWEVFQDVMVESRGSSMEEQMPFRLYTVSDSKAPLRITGGMQVVPDYTFDEAPQPRIVVVGAQRGKSPKMLDWIRKMTAQSDVVMSVCTGAYRLAQAGVLKGKKATTHHDFYDDFQKQFPDVSLQRGLRFVQSDPVVFTAGGLSSGIDLALHIVQLYFGRAVAEKTAKYMEYEGKGWLRDAG
jgi:transcriptional regulator GlxA family with amidase domain